MPKKKSEENIIEVPNPEIQESAAEPVESETGDQDSVMIPVQDNETDMEKPEPAAPKSRKKKMKDESDLPIPAEAIDSEKTEEPAPDLLPEPAATLPEAGTEEERTIKRQEPILTLEAGADVSTEAALADIAWHEIHNAYRTRRILTGSLGGLEQTDNGKTLAIVEYKGFRIVIPLKEMVMNMPNNLTGSDYTDMIVRQHKLLSRMLGAEIDFVIKGIDSKTRSVVASRREAMLKKRKTFYFDANENGEYRIYEGRIIQARVIATAEKAIRIEAFGVECSILARDLSWEWIGDARDHFSVGDQILVRILHVSREDLEHVTIKADVKSVSDNRSNKLELCRIQSKYAGKVTDVHKGVVYIRLTNGINAVAHSCYDRRMPGKKDDVSFVVTGIDAERGIALGIITRIIKQNL